MYKSQNMRLFLQGTFSLSAPKDLRIGVPEKRERKVWKDTHADSDKGKRQGYNFYFLEVGIK